MGPVLTAELLAHTTEYASAAKLAAHAGIARVSWDSGGISGYHRAARRYHAVLRNVFWMFAYTARSDSAPIPAPSTTENGPKANTTTKPSSPSPAAASSPLGPHPRPPDLPPHHPAGGRLTDTTPQDQPKIARPLGSTNTPTTMSIGRRKLRCCSEVPAPRGTTGAKPAREPDPGAC
jgi:hypothetical protein